MVKGVELFRTFFKDYTDNYILIGGAACDDHIREAGLTFRATKDLDIILVIEALNAEFAERFWNFVKAGAYEKRQKGQRKRTYYRFMKPAHAEYPWQLELFARKPDLLILYEGAHLTPIPITEDASSLSAILMDDEYYSFVIKHSEVVGELHRATLSTLICLKAKAFLELKNSKEEGERIDEKDIRKHKNDVVRLASLLAEKDLVKLPDSIARDMRRFMLMLENDPPNFRAIAKTMGLPGLDSKAILNQLHQTFYV